MSERDQRKKAATLLAAETLKEITRRILQETVPQHSTKRGSREAHPRAVLSTNYTAASRPRGCSSPSDRTPVNPSAHNLSLSPQVVASPRCSVSRQRSTPVDLPPPTASAQGSHENDGHDGQNNRSPSTRPASLGLRRDLSSHSGSSNSPEVSTPCCSPSLGVAAPDARQLGSSYPPGPFLTRVLCCEASTTSQHGEYLLGSEGHQALARKIAERLIAIGDEVNADAGNFTVTEILESFISSYDLNHGSDWTWGTVGRLFGVLSQLLTESVHSGMESESWFTFAKFWKTVLQTVPAWIADNGGWFALIRATDDTTSSFMSSTPDCYRRRFTYSNHHPPQCTEAPRYSTPQVPRRPFGQNQSSPAVCCGARRGERGSRVLSLTQDGLLAEGMFPFEEAFEGGTSAYDESPTREQASGEEEAQTSPDEGIQFLISTGSLSSLECSLTETTPPKPRPQSSTESTLPEGGSAFDRNRSLSYPTRQRPNSARLSQSQQARRSGGAEDREVVLCESMDSGLAASSNTSMASSDSSLHYSTIGVSALCVFEAVKSMLDRK